MAGHALPQTESAFNFDLALIMDAAAEAAAPGAEDEARSIVQAAYELGIANARKPLSIPEDGPLGDERRTHIYGGPATYSTSHPKCECGAAGIWGATGKMPVGHHWHWRNGEHTSGYLAHN